MGLSATVELQGHLIDSLTLSKVIDRVQQLGGDYQLNDIRLGSLKKDITYVNMTLLAESQSVMDQLVEAIAPYGVVVGLDREEAKTITCEADGHLPVGAYEVRLPKRVFRNGGWQDVNNGGPWALVLQDGKLCMKQASELHRGEALICGTSGLQW